MLYFYPVYFETCSGSNEKNHISLNSEKKNVLRQKKVGKKLTVSTKKQRGTRKLNPFLWCKHILNNIILASKDSPATRAQQRVIFTCHHINLFCAPLHWASQFSTSKIPQPIFRATSELYWSLNTLNISNLGQYSSETEVPTPFWWNHSAKIKQNSNNFNNIEEVWVCSK